MKIKIKDCDINIGDIFIFTGLIFYIVENIYFGFNLIAQSNVEKFWGGIASVLAIYGVFKSFIIGVKPSVEIDLNVNIQNKLDDSEKVSGNIHETSDLIEKLYPSPSRK